MSVVTLYSREGCHLCDAARDDLLAMRDGLPAFELVEVDIESDDSLLKRYLERIPVFEVDGREVCDLGLDAVALHRALVSTLREA